MLTRNKKERKKERNRYSSTNMNESQFSIFYINTNITLLGAMTSDHEEKWLMIYQAHIYVTYTK